MQKRCIATVLLDRDAASRITRRREGLLRRGREFMLPQQNLDLDDVAGRRFIETHFAGRTILYVPRTQVLQRARGYQNVREAIAKRGGSAQFGWLLTWWPSRYIEALHHSVWRRPDGKMEDVTAPAFPPMAACTSSSFIEDNETEDCLPFDPGSRRFSSNLMISSLKKLTSPPLSGVWTSYGTTIQRLFRFTKNTEFSASQSPKPNQE